MSKGRKILFALVALSVVFAPIGIASAETYDFTNVPLLHEACEGYDDQLPADSSPDYQEELSASEYTAISASDDSRAEYDRPGEPQGEYDFHRFKFKIDENPSVISQLYLRHEGYGYSDVGGYGLELFIWNYSSSTWESVGSHYAGGDGIIEAATTSGFSDYIDSNGYLLLLAETKYHHASCPYLYAWNGIGFGFIADFNTHGGLGYYDGSAGKPYYPRPEDYTKIDGLQLEPCDGVYRVEIAEDQDEVVYLDQVKLLVVDHPQGTEIYTPTMTKFAQPYPFKVYTIREARPPISAVDENGEDILPIISEVDRIYTEGKDFYWDTITLDFGDLSGAEEIKLVFNAYMDWPLAPEIAARYMTEEYRARVEVINEDGDWEEVALEEPLGLPVAKPRTYVVDITDWFKTEDYRVRIHYYEKALFDYIAVDTSEDGEVLVSELDPVSADLHWKGVAREFSPDGRKPLIADYYTTVDASGFEPFAGNFTRYGDVLPLLTQVDDKFVIMHAGDDISLAFNEVPVSEGMERDYFLFSDAYYKLHFVRMLLGEDISSVDPLPFHGMSAYPYPDDEGYPYDAEHMAYLEEYNTREVVASPPGESEHHTIYTDYVKVEVDLASAGPDLVAHIDSVTLNESGYLSCNYTVTNVGTEATPDSSTTAEYINGINVWTVGCPQLAPAESHSGTFSPVFYPVPCGGTCNVTVCADDWHYYQESDEGNNCDTNTVAPPCPDLVVSKSVAFDEYGNFVVSYNVTNQGTVEAGPSTTAKYVNSIWQDSQSCPSLGPGESHNGTFSSQPCSDFASCGGTFNVTVCADDYWIVEETNDHNNCDVNIVERPCPDLVVSKSVRFDDYGNFIVDYTVTNQGTVWAGEIETGKYVNGVWQEGHVLLPLGPGESHNGTFSSQPCSDFASCGGTFNVTVCADDDGDVEEMNEDNNCEVNIVQRPCPKIVDPKQDSLYLDADGNGAASPGDILQYVAEIRNEGNATATGVTFTDTVDANTSLMCAAPYAPMASQGSITSCSPGAGGSLAADLGDMDPGGVATVTFYVRIGYGDFDQVHNQGIVAGGNFADAPTDDPDTTDPDDPTDTPISPPGPSPAPAVATVNHWGTVAMIALFAGLLVWRMRRRLSAS